MIKFLHVCMAAVVCVCVVGGNPATATDNLFWELQNTMIPYSVSNSTAVAMSSGHAWPIIMLDGYQIARLRATPGAHGTNWHVEDLPTVISGVYVGKSSNDGRVAFYRPGQLLQGVYVLDPDGSVTLLPNYGSAAFTADGQLRVAYDQRVNGLGYVGGQASSGFVLDMAIAPDGTVGVVDSNFDYYEYRYGSWGAVPFSLTTLGVTPVTDSVRVAFDVNSRPHIAFHENVVTTSPAYTADFSTVTGGWSLTDHGETETYLALAGTALGDGDLGIAFVDAVTGDLVYRSFDVVTSQWSSHVVVEGLHTAAIVGLAYDFAGLPVISYQKDDELWLAYDPIVVIPEPASLVLLGLGAVVVLRWRR